MAYLNPIKIGKSRVIHKLIGGTADIRQPLPIVFPEVRDRLKKANANTWHPEDISMSTDKQTWGNIALRDDERHMFELNISYLTASDAQVPLNIVHAIMPHLTNHQAFQYYLRQLDEENIHINSYLYILESLGIDVEGQGAIYALYHEVQALADKLNWNVEYSNRAASLPVGDSGVPRALMEVLVAYLVFEYLFFPCAFAQVFALAENGKLVNTAEQYQYIWRDEDLHAAHGFWMIRQLIKENPSAWDKTMEQRAAEIIAEGLEKERAYAMASMPGGGVMGLRMPAYLDYANLRADLLCKGLGIAPRFFGNKSEPVPWVSKYHMKHEGNFFEKRVKEYQVGQLTWDD